MQLDYWTSASETTEGEDAAPKQDTPELVSTKIEQIGQRMRNVEEVFSALKENLDQILSNLQDGILLFTGDGRTVLVSEAARRFLQIDQDRLLGLHRPGARRDLHRHRLAGPAAARLRDRRRHALVCR